MPARTIFISYSRVDGQQYAVELSARLRKAGANVWLDQVDIEPGKIWDFEIEKALQASEAVIFIATEKSTSSNNVLNEVYYALEENKEVIPVIFHNCKMPFRLKRLQYIDFTTDYETALARLLKTLRLDPRDPVLPVKENLEKPTAVSEKKSNIETVASTSTRQEIKKQPEITPAREHIALPPVNRTPPQNRKSNNTLFWLIGGVGVLLMILAAVYSGNTPADKKEVYHSTENNGSDTPARKEPAVSNTPVTDRTKLNSNWRSFTQANYGIQYPPNWDLNEHAGLGTSFALFSRLENGNDAFRENVSLMIQNLAGSNMDLDKFATLSEQQVKTLAVNGVLLESKRVDDGQYPHHRILYTSDQNPYHLTTEQYYWVINEQAYVLTLSCEQDKFSMYQQVGEQILNSFYFK